VGGDGKPAKELPLKDGYFEVALPRAFFEGNPKAITLNWIDCYRGSTSCRRSDNALSPPPATMASL